MINRLFEKLLQEDEQIDYIIHKHWISLVWPFLKSLSMGLLLPALMIWLYWGDPTLTLIGVAWLLLGTVWTIHTFLDWHYDAFLVTDQHLIEIDWRGFFRRTANRIRYENIDNVSYNSKGILSSIFGFADLKIVTFASEEKDLRYANNARDFQNILMERSEKNRPDEDGSPLSKADLKKALRSLVQEELADEEQLVEAASEEGEQDPEIVIVEQKKIRKKKS
jgi:uncharacterized membrane protein YdbT with pleckstrin-like domain